ncbi:hypothetical protein KSD_30060 [Ktedonobacter sp. SOSP1-85]|uniref:hypothetical protein n=1 Tax=Ktedonobacter sp. SOSP1-85 TaxID=2778367 RepID=UPI001915BF50|nr:hypothetical protein [Ktedonobacter sp. SOSP1-85]GHO75235.1 hypothetical protein KSD_30060 [Ktedonobacter sp. SOSP1-85]
MSSSTITTPLKALSPHFQRSINVVYDAGNADYVSGYIPTPNGAEALASILDGTVSTATQRSHILHAAYGSGKSLLGIVLGTFASKDADCHDALSVVQERLMRRFPTQAERINQYARSEMRLLPVILSGDEKNLATALTRALSRALTHQGLSHLKPRTQFESALSMISLWETSYPDAHQQLQSKLLEKGSSLSKLTDKLQALNREALILFEQLYPEITAGAQFDYNTGPSLESIFHATAEALHDSGYEGIIVIWDEFGRFLDSRAGEPFGAEAALLQSFAEFCNRSGSSQVHLVLITHQLMSSYAAGLPLVHQQEWARIAERFRNHDISSDPNVMYQLIVEAISTPDTKAWQRFTDIHRSAFNQLTAVSFDLSLFNELDDVALRQHIIEQAWPLHPLTIYALPRLASRVAQNERTLFTFLAADEPGTLADLLTDWGNVDTWNVLSLDLVWDYFADAIRSDTKPGGAHPIWSGTMHALGKLGREDNITQSLVKALAILLIVNEVNTQSQGASDRVLPTTEILAWALGISADDVAARLETLTQRRVVVYRRSDGYWTFTRGSDVDLDTELSAALERRSPNQQQIRLVVERYVPLPYYLPRRYNQEHSITRFFNGIYCWSGDMKRVSAELFLKQLGEHGYADGAIAYVLATNAAEREEAIRVVQNLPSSRTVYVIPDQPLLLAEPVRELFALDDLSNDPVFMQKDERLPTEIAFFVEDARTRLLRALNPLLQPSLAKATWWWYEGSEWRSGHWETDDISRLLSGLCDQWFNKTPTLNNELVNQQEPSGQQERALEKVIEVLLGSPQDALPPDFGLQGHGPDWLIVRTLLIRTTLVQLTATGYGILRKPTNGDSLAEAWEVIQNFANTAVEREQEASTLIDRLQSPPFGLRRGVLPLLVAAALHFRLPVLTMRQSRKIVSPVTAEVFIKLCKQPEQYTIELGPWDARRSILWSILEERVESFVSDQKQTQQPLNALSIGLLRWLQSLPRYCRDTNLVSTNAQEFRNLLRKAQREPARVLSYDLLELLENDSIDVSNEDKYRQIMRERLSNLMDEIAAAYQMLLYSLDRFVRETFASDASDGHAAIVTWLKIIEEQAEKPLRSLRFSDQLAQRLVQVASENESKQTANFWDHLSKAILGISLSDWNDRSNETFRHNLLEARKRIENEIFDLSSDETAVKLSVALPEKSEQTYRFRQSGLSPQGQRILQNFKSTLEISGRPLSLDEKRQIALALLDYVMGGSNVSD